MTLSYLYCNLKFERKNFNNSPFFRQNQFFDSVYWRFSRTKIFFLGQWGMRYCFRLEIKFVEEVQLTPFCKKRIMVIYVCLKFGVIICNIGLNWFFLCVCCCAHLAAANAKLMNGEDCRTLLYLFQKRKKDSRLCVKLLLYSNKIFKS